MSKNVTNKVKVIPQHILNTTPSLNCSMLSRSFYTVDTQDKIKAIVEMRKRQATLYADAVASYLNVQITADMYK